MKATQRRARETRTVYRIKRKRARTKPISQKRGEATTVPWERRIAPTDEQVRDWDAWLIEHEPEFEKEYPGHYLAIWDKRIIAATSDRKLIYKLAHQARPEVVPLITYVPRERDIYMAPSNFPEEWAKK